MNGNGSLTISETATKRVRKTKANARKKKRTFAQWLNEICCRFPRSSGRWHPRPHQSIASCSASGLGVKTSRRRLTLVSRLYFHVNLRRRAFEILKQRRAKPALLVEFGAVIPVSAGLGTTPFQFKICARKLFATKNGTKAVLRVRDARRQIGR